MKKLIFTIEHAKGKIPKYIKVKIPKNKINSHYGYDLGILNFVNSLCKNLEKTVIFKNNFTRLLLDQNRKPNSIDFYSKYSIFHKNLILSYLNFRHQVEKEILLNYGKKEIILISWHSFTPIWNNKERKTDIGILFNPKNELEKKLALKLFKYLKINNKKYKVHLNKPYHGKSDAFVNDLNNLFLKENFFSGICIEINQKYLLSKNYDYKELIFLFEQFFKIHVSV